MSRKIKEGDRVVTPLGCGVFVGYDLEGYRAQRLKIKIDVSWTIPPLNPERILCFWESEVYKEYGFC